MAKHSQKKQPRKLKTVRDVVKALGGTAKTAEFTLTTLPAVSNWMAEGYIPPGWHYCISLRLESKGFEVDPCAFGLDKDGVPLRHRRVA
jgi:hypothetical protein